MRREGVAFLAELPERLHLVFTCKWGQVGGPADRRAPLLQCRSPSPRTYFLNPPVGPGLARCGPVGSARLRPCQPDLCACVAGRRCELWMQHGDVHLRSGLGLQDLSKRLPLAVGLSVGTERRTRRRTNHFIKVEEAT